MTTNRRGFLKLSGAAAAAAATHADAGSGNARGKSLHDSSMRDEIRNLLHEMGDDVRYRSHWEGQRGLFKGIFGDADGTAAYASNGKLVVRVEDVSLVETVEKWDTTFTMDRVRMWFSDGDLSGGRWFRMDGLGIDPCALVKVGACLCNESVDCAGCCRGIWGLRSDPVGLMVPGTGEVMFSRRQLWLVQSWARVGDVWMDANPNEDGSFSWCVRVRGTAKVSGAVMPLTRSNEIDYEQAVLPSIRLYSDDARDSWDVMHARRKEALLV